MRLHRFYIDPRNQQLTHDFWLHDNKILAQWTRVLRFRVGQEVVLFDGEKRERLYKVTELTEQEAHLELVNDMVRQVPMRDIYIAWALLKKDKNDWVLQKCTEIGVNHFLPLLTERCEKTGFNEERAYKIVIEAAEQCGRSNIPAIRTPLGLGALLEEFSGKMPIYICEQTGQKVMQFEERALLCVGPEGGWSEREQELFQQHAVTSLSLGGFTHRAETASMAAASKLLQ